jgi:hypothetical protein
MAKVSPLEPVTALVVRREDHALVRNRPMTTFVSTCPKCGHERLQHGYTRRILVNLLTRRSNIDAYCVNCNVCWPIPESDRRALSPQLILKLQACNGARSAWCSRRRMARDPSRRDSRKLPVSRASLQQALRTLRAIRLRYEIDRRKSDARIRSVLVALSCADMQWVTAAIETLETTIAAGATEAAGLVVRAGVEP